MIYLENIPPPVPEDIARRSLEDRIAFWESEFRKVNQFLEPELYASVMQELGTVYLEYMERYFNSHPKVTIPSNV